MFNLITHEVNNERSDYLYTHFLLETNGSAPSYFIPSLFLPSLQYCNTGHWSHFGFFAVQ